MGSLRVSKASLPTDWNELISAYWASWTLPLTAWGELACPFIGTHTPAETLAQKEMRERAFEELSEDPDIHLFKCTDTQTNKIVGGGFFRVYHAGAPPRKVEAVWFPEGSEMRELSERAWDHLLDWKMRLMKDTFVCAEEAWIIPEYRKQGAGAALVEEFIRFADEHGLQGYTETTRLNRRIMERCGFIPIAFTDVPCERKDVSEDWTRLARNLRDNPLCIMWRPVGGVYVEGLTEVPWEAKSMVKSRQAKL